MLFLLLPFKEYSRIDEHLYTFDFNNIQTKFNDLNYFILIGSTLINVLEWKS